MQRSARGLSLYIARTLIVSLFVLLVPSVALGDAKEAEALRGKARTAMESKDWSTAISLLERAHKADPTNHGILKDLAVVHAGAGNITESVAQYQLYLKEVPTDDAARLAMATTLSWSKDKAQLKQAEDQLTDFINKHPGSDDALLQRARVRSWTGQSELAEKDYRAYLAKHSTDGKVKLELAMALSSRKDPAALNAAIAIYDAHLAANPNDIEIVLQRGRVRSWAGLITEAAVDYRAYIKVKPEDTAVRLELARALSWSKKPEEIRESINMYRAHLTTNPTDDVARLELARALLKSKSADQIQEGAGLLDQYVASHPNDDNAILERGRARTAAGLTPLAIADYRAYLAKHPGDEKVSLELAEALSSSKDPAVLKEAIALLDAYIAKHPNDADANAILKRGRIRGWVGMTAEGAKDLRTYAQMKPGDDTIDLEIANLLALSAEPGESIPYYDRYFARHPQDVDSRPRYARALLWSGNYARAETEITALRKTAKTPEQKTELDLDLARLYAQTNRRYEAIDVLDAVLAREPKNENALIERSRLSIVLGSSVTPRAFYYQDKSGIVIGAAGVDVKAALNRRLAIIGDVSGYTLGTTFETIRTMRINAGAWGRYKFLELEAAAGPRTYEHFDPYFGARASVTARPVSFASLTLDYHFDDIYYDMLQPTSVAAQIRGHAMFLTGEATLPMALRRIRVTGRIGSRLLQPDNKSLDATGTISVPVYGPVSVGYNVQYITWRYNDPAYWSPQAFVAHLGIIRVAQTLARSGFGYDVQAVGGIAGERIAHVPEAGFGRSFGASGAISYAVNDRLLLRLSMQYSQTIREIPPPIVGGSAAVKGPPPPEAGDEPSIYWWITGVASATFFF